MFTLSLTMFYAMVTLEALTEWATFIVHLEALGTICITFGGIKSAGLTFTNLTAIVVSLIAASTMN